MAVATAALDVERLDATVEDAIRAGEAGPLKVLGYGEITLVLGWPTGAPELAVKRLPVFRDGARLEAYAALLRRYIAVLRERGVDVVNTDVVAVPAAGAVRAYLVQPLAPVERLLNRVLRTASPERGRALLEALVERVCATVDRHVGLDAQASNWVVDGTRLACLDLSTPMLRTDEGRDLLDVDLFLSIYPWALRGPLKPVAHSVMGNYHDARGVLLDTASNLHKERLDRWIPALLDAANARLAKPITVEEVRRYFTQDKLLWTAMQRLRRADRAWQRRVRRRPYPFLLPPPYRYGPPELPGETP